MSCSNSLANHPTAAFSTVVGFAVPGGMRQAANIVDSEPGWRHLPRDAAPLSESKVIATRWHAIGEARQEFGAETADDCHVVKIVLRNMDIRLSVAGRTVQDGVMTPGMFHITESANPVRCLFRGPYDALHLHVPNSLIGELTRDMPGRAAPLLGARAASRKDAKVEWLARALLQANDIGGASGQLYADSVSTAIVARLLASARGTAVAERPRVAELPQWRLRRVMEYIEARLAESVSLADIAAVAGLTRMHFAAQFRAATGLRPHEYLLRRRIERAQEMLVGTGSSLAEIALAVGFQTQSHFTSVFARFAGLPPRAWRESCGLQQARHAGG